MSEFKKIRKWHLINGLIMAAYARPPFLLELDPSCITMFTSFSADI
jgi:hypothetical protein